MSLAPRSIARSLRLVQAGPSRRHNTTISPNTETSTATSTPPPPPPTQLHSPPLSASLLLSRPPLLLPTPHPLESAYHQHSLSLRYALSNPPSLPFLFREGSLPSRRFQLANHAYETSIFGPELAGKKPDVGDMPIEDAEEEVDRYRWEKEDAGRGERSLERVPEGELFCLMKRKEGGRWELPNTAVRVGEGLDEAVERGLTGVEGAFNGETLDTWIVTRKPIGMYKTGDEHSFVLRSKILAGEPKLDASSPWSEHAWLTTSEVEQRLTEQGDGELWNSIRGMFGVVDEEAVDAELD